jgi:hypothetical protein
MDKSVEAIEARVAFDRMISERNAGADRPRRPVSAPTGPLVPALTVIVHQSESARLTWLAHAAADAAVDPVEFDRYMEACRAELDAILAGGAGLVDFDDDLAAYGFPETSPRIFEND